MSLYNKYIETYDNHDKAKVLYDTYLAIHDFSLLHTKPFVMTNIAKQWSILKTLQLENLVENFPNINEDIRTDFSDKKSITLKKYAQLIKENKTKELYFKTQFHLYTDLKLGYTVPEAFRCWYAQFPVKSKRYALSWIYIGGQGTSTGLHMDVWDTSAWNVVVSGLKLWLFFSPEQSSYLYNGSVDPFAPDLNKFPEFIYAKPLIVIQHPGELVYTPSKWWHAVYNIESGVSLTENFMNETNIENVQDFFLQRKQFKSLASINKIAKYFNYTNHES